MSGLTKASLPPNASAAETDCQSGNVQEVMNRVLVAERTAEAQLVEARTKAQTQQIEAQAKAEVRAVEARSAAEAQRQAAEADAQAQRLMTEADIAALRLREEAASAYSAHPALLRLRELDTLAELAKLANARIYI